MYLFIIDSVIIFIALGAGIAAVLLPLYLQKNFKSGFINSFMYYEMLLFVFGLYGLFGNILVRNLVGDIDISRKIIDVIIHTIPYLGVPVLFIAWFMFLKSCMEFKVKSVRKYFGIAYFASVFVVLTAYVITFLFLVKDGNYDRNTILLFNKIFLLSVNIIVIIVALSILFAGWVRVKSRINKKLIGGFLIANLISGILSQSSFYFADYNFVTERAYLFLFFVSMLLPAWYLYFFFNRNADSFKKSDCKENSAEKIMADYQLTKREWEVIEKICVGKTNNEISDELFVSLQTVKDHVYRIFKKTGVKNRVQLVNLININS